MLDQSLVSEELAEREKSDWTDEQLFNDAAAYFDALLKDLDAATDSIDLDYYIVELDVLGSRVVDALAAAARRGVRVRMIMDGIGSFRHAETIALRLSAAGAQVRIFHPHPLYPRMFRWSIRQGNFWQKLIHFVLNFNQRDHHKLCIVDRSYIYAGSFNLSAKHLGREKGGENWHDYGVRLCDEDSDDIAGCFDSLWSWASVKPRRLRMRRLRSNLSLHMRATSNKLMVQRISEARERIWICNAYFSPTHAVLKALRTARENGVEVRLILPARSDVYWFPLVTRTYYPALLRSGVEIYEYLPDILHAKVMLIDQQCLIGSTNMNHRSYYHDLELDIVLTRESSIRQLEQWLREDILRSRRISAASAASPPAKLVASRLLRLFRYWM